MSEKKPEKWKVNEDCFAYYINGRGKDDCRCLDKIYCATTNCNFYKSKKDLSWEKIKSDLLLHTKNSKDEF